MSFLIMRHAHDRLLGFLKTQLVISADTYVERTQGRSHRLFHPSVWSVASLLMTELLFSCSCCLGRGTHCGDDQGGQGGGPHGHTGHTQLGQGRSLMCLHLGRRP